MENVDIYALIDELQEELALSKNCLLSKNKSVNAEVMNEIIADIRKALDDTLQYAKQIEEERESILQSAKTQSDRIIQEAQVKAQEMVSENAITESAYEQAQKVMDKTKQKTQEMRAYAVDYAEDIFRDLEEYYKDSMELLQENLARLNNKKEK